MYPFKYYGCVPTEAACLVVGVAIHLAVHHFILSIANQWRLYSTAETDLLSESHFVQTS